jgi:GrpB-like predicted nucleotidyltransferase (UPF0157 family)
MPDPIIVVDYDPGWPAEFERLRTRAADAVGELAVAIEHVGSTAVPGLAAKPVIDLDVVVEPVDVGGAIERLEAVGYTHYASAEVVDREWLSAPKGEKRHHLYVCPTDSDQLREHLAFRNALRESPALAAGYEALKREFAVRFRDDRHAYTEAKTEFIRSALRSCPRASA